MTVRCRVRRKLGADHGVAAGTVVDDHILLEHRRQVLAQRPRQDVGSTARRERNDQADRPGRIVLRGYWSGSNNAAC